MRPLRIAQVGPVAGPIPPVRSGSVELMTSLLTEGLVAQGHRVTLFATGGSSTSATLAARFPRGYGEDPAMWPWEAYEIFNIAAAVERASEFDVIHYQAMFAPLSVAFTRLTTTPLVQTLHHAPSEAEVQLWRQYPQAPFIAVSDHQRHVMTGVNVIATVTHGIDTSAFAFRAVPEDYLVFLGRFTRQKGVPQAIEVARRAGLRLVLAAAVNDYYREEIAPLVDGVDIVYAGELDHAGKVALLRGARALVYPIQAAEPFGLVLAEAMACGTPVVALDCGAVREVVEHGVNGGVFENLDAMVAGLPSVLALDRALVRQRAVDRFGLDRMVEGYVAAYRRLIDVNEVYRKTSDVRHGTRV